ncbi:hypothetical protein QTP70_021348 [Hemibagrus guttatus]|uniref:Reverse transcriptase domain-containing protein n=1 Tax=Hemibagrus guttatus TaxID=175788 RepID=A0AAE0QGJ0_9TELE|nr:hypothetical protein QTP70_021348 [Hemibagrus guttatus]
MPHREEAPGKTQDTLERLCLSAGLETPRGPSGRAGGRVWGEGGYLCFPLLTSVLRDETQWESPLIFNPAHFLDEQGQFVKKDAFMPFSAADLYHHPCLFLVALQQTGNSRAQLPPMFETETTEKGRKCDLCFVDNSTYVCESSQEENNEPPGPKPLPILGNMLQLNLKRPYLSLFEMSKKYGSVFTVHLGPMKVVVLAGYQTVKQALVNYAEEFGNRHISPFFFDINKGHVSVTTPINLFIIVIYRPLGPLDLISYRTLLSKFSLDVTSAKTSFYKEKLETSAQDPRKLHNIFSSLLNPPAPPSPSSLTTEDFASFYTEKIERICQTFTSLPTSPTSHNQHSATPSLTQLSTVAAEEVLQITRSCNPTTCPLDPVPSAMLQTISPDLLPFITTVINGSLTSGHVPTAFKKARVIPILKKPALDPSDISNYRPVSLLSFLSKILESVVCNQLSDYLMQNNLHDPNQSGFKAAHSTETALLAVTEKLHAARSAKLSSVLILLDLSAAFDRVNHKTLLSTLRSLGICGTAWEWFASYLDGRSYQVTWKGLTSAPRRLSTGVPQGSVLGPLLFSLYTHSLGKVISSHGFSYHCYNDDTQLIFSFPPSNTTTSARISACLADISSWMTAHQLKLNPSKTELLIIPGDPSPAQDLAISLSNSMISPSATARNLGVTMDHQLSFSSHVTNVTRSCRFLLYNIRRIRPFLSTQATQVLVQSLVISRLDYCNSLLAGLPLNAIRPLQMNQNAAARVVFNLPKFSHTTPLLRSLHWLPVAARIRYKTLMLAYKAKNGPAPSYLKALVTSRTAPRLLRSTSTARLVPPSLREKGILFSNGENWKEMRRFSLTTLRNFGMGKRGSEEIIIEETCYLRKVFEEFQGKPFGTSQPLNYAISNVISTIVYGSRFQYSDPEFKSMVNRAKDIIKLGGSSSIQIYNMFPWLGSWLNDWKLTMKKREQNLKQIKELVNNLEETLNVEETRGLVDSFLIRKKNAEKAGDKDTLFHEQNLMITVSNLFAAGTDTTSATLSWCLLLMAKYPQIQAKGFLSISFDPAWLYFPDKLLRLMAQVLRLPRWGGGLDHGVRRFDLEEDILLAALGSEKLEVGEEGHSSLDLPPQSVAFEEFLNVLTLGMFKAILHPRVGYVLKVPRMTGHLVILQTFCPPPHELAEQERLHWLCLASFGSRNKGNVVSKQHLAHWVVEATTQAYKAHGIASPLSVRAHSTRDRVQEEIDRVIGHRQAVWEDRKYLPYTDAVIHETQRLANVVPMSLPHTTTCDVKFQGFLIKKVNLDETQWESPLIFNPAHFLDEQGQFVKKDAFMPFSAGRRVCLGESLAKMELFLFFTSLLQHFRFTPPPGVSEDQLDLTPAVGLTLNPSPHKLCAANRASHIYS